LRFLSSTTSICHRHKPHKQPQHTGGRVNGGRTAHPPAGQRDRHRQHGGKRKGCGGRGEHVATQHCTHHETVPHEVVHLPRGDDFLRLHFALFQLAQAPVQVLRGRGPREGSKGRVQGKGPREGSKGHGGHRPAQQRNTPVPHASPAPSPGLSPHGAPRRTARAVAHGPPIPPPERATHRVLGVHGPVGDALHGLQTLLLGILVQPQRSCVALDVTQLQAKLLQVRLALLQRE
jgi:hypothetical protein